MVAYVQGRALWLSAIRTGNWAIEPIAYQNMQRAFKAMLNDCY